MITGSVGSGGTNRHEAVKSIQLLLNDWRTSVQLPKIAVDGIVGPETIGAISEFQGRHPRGHPRDDRKRRQRRPALDHRRRLPEHHRGFFRGAGGQPDLAPIPQARPDHSAAERRETGEAGVGLDDLAGAGK